MVHFLWSPLYTGVVMQSFSIHKCWFKNLREGIQWLLLIFLVSVSSLSIRGCIFGFNDCKYCPYISDQELSNMLLLILKLSIVFVRNFGVIYLLISTLPLKTSTYHPREEVGKYNQRAHIPTFGRLTKCSICFIAAPFSSHQKSVSCRIPTSTW